jgi:Protein of unknown function (DUF2934)
MDSDKEARIRERAHDIWVREGQPHGKSAEHWQMAEAEIAAESGAVADRAAAGSKPRTEAPIAIADPPGAGAAPPLRSRRVAAKPAGSGRPGTSESGGTGGRRGKKTRDT